MNVNNWKDFLDNSSKLTKPAKATQLISNKDVDEIKLLLTDVLKGFLAKEDIHVGLKTYVNNELRNDFIDKMVANPPTLEHSLEDWSKQIFENQKFGMVLIGLEQYSNAFAEKAANIINPLLENAGLPLDGLSFLFFMGNYGFTPFGIHKEATGEDGILFHLGPKDKEFYTWDDPKYNSIIHNSEVFHNVQEMLPKGKVHELKAGDAMFIPHYVYHIGNTPEFSLSFVLDYVNPPKDRFENELIKETAKEELLLHNEYEQPIKLNSPQSVINQIIDLESIRKKMEIALERKILGLKSNGGIRRISNRTHTHLPSAASFSIKGKKIFPIYLDIQNSKEAFIFARGHRIILKKHDKLHVLVEQINKAEFITLSYLRNLLEPTWDLVDIYGLIQELLNIEAIITVGTNSKTLN